MRDREVLSFCSCLLKSSLEFKSWFAASYVVVVVVVDNLILPLMPVFSFQVLLHLFIYLFYFSFHIPFGFLVERGAHVWKDIHALLTRMSSMWLGRGDSGYLDVFWMKRDRFAATSYYLIVLGRAGGRRHQDKTMPTFNLTVSNN